MLYVFVIYQKLPLIIYFKRSHTTSKRYKLIRLKKLINCSRRYFLKIQFIHIIFLLTRSGVIAYSEFGDTPPKYISSFGLILMLIRLGLLCLSTITVNFFSFLVNRILCHLPSFIFFSELIGRVFTFFFLPSMLSCS